MGKETRMPLIKIVENLACAMTQALASAVHLRLEQLARRDWHPAQTELEADGFELVAGHSPHRLLLPRRWCRAEEGQKLISNLLG
jgi:hypothetical protein